MQVKIFYTVSDFPARTFDGAVKYQPAETPGHDDMVAMVAQHHSVTDSTVKIRGFEMATDGGEIKVWGHHQYHPKRVCWWGRTPDVKPGKATQAVSMAEAIRITGGLFDSWCGILL